MPWGTKQLRRLGVALRDHQEPPASCPPYPEVMAWFDELAASVQERIRAEDWSDILGDRGYDTTSRPKTIETLRQKLQRDRSTPLPNIQDIAGVRFEAEMSLLEQDAIVRRIALLFEHDPDDDSVVRNLRETPHSGYRAVHVWLRLPQGRVEVQVRTALQGAWANLYETAGDLFGRGIRYGEVPKDANVRELVQTLISVSTEEIAFLETTPIELAELDQELRGMSPRGGWVFAPILWWRHRRLLRRHQKISVRIETTRRRVTEMLHSLRRMMLSDRPRGE